MELRRVEGPHAKALCLLWESQAVCAAGVQEVESDLKGPAGVPIPMHSGVWKPGNACVFHLTSEKDSQ